MDWSNHDGGESHREKETQRYGRINLASRNEVFHNSLESVKPLAVPGQEFSFIVFETKAIVKRRNLIKAPSGRKTPRSRPVVVVRSNDDVSGSLDSLDDSFPVVDDMDVAPASPSSRWDEFGGLLGSEIQSSPLMQPKRFKDTNVTEPIAVCLSVG